MLLFLCVWEVLLSWRGCARAVTVAWVIARLPTCCLETTKVGRIRADSTLRFSRAVPHPSTNRALRRLTSEVRRDPVHSTRYGRQRKLNCESVRDGEMERETGADSYSQNSCVLFLVCSHRFQTLE
jgi:hypothetical protein